MKNESRIVHEDLARQISHLMSRPDRVLTFPGETESKELDGIQTGGSRSAIRNVQGSSAGAGSGEFHVYRALRRKEQVRIRTIDDRNKEVSSPHSVLFTRNP